MHTEMMMNEHLSSAHEITLITSKNDRREFLMAVIQPDTDVYKSLLQSVRESEIAKETSDLAEDTTCDPFAVKGADDDESDISSEWWFM